MEKIKIEKRIYSFKEDFLEGKIENVIERIKEFKINAEKEGFENITFTKITDWDYGEIEGYGFILETDEELNERIKIKESQENKKKLKEEKERKKYEELKAKFG
mgnify:FL=1